MNPKCMCRYNFGPEQLLNSSLTLTAIHDRLEKILGDEEFSFKGERKKLNEIIQAILAQIEIREMLDKHGSMTLIPPCVIPKAKAIGVLEVAEKRLEDLKGQMPLTEEDDEKRKELEIFRRNSKPDHGEAETLYQLSKVLAKEKAIVFHSLQRSEYLKILDEKVKQQSHGLEETDPIVDLQKKCCEYFRIDLGEFEKEVSQIDLSKLRELFKFLKSRNAKALDKKLLNGIWSGSEPQFTSTFLTSMKEDIRMSVVNVLSDNKLWRKLDHLNGLTDDELTIILVKGFIKVQREAMKKEVDILTILTDKKILLQVEVKTAVDSAANNEKTVLKTLKSACEQNEAMLKWVRQLYEGTFDEEWIYVKVAALPHTKREDLKDTGACATGHHNPSYPCLNCHEFIMTKETVESFDEMEKFIKNVIKRVEETRANATIDEDRALKSADIFIGHLMSSLVIGEKFHKNIRDAVKETAEALVGEYGITTGEASKGEEEIVKDLTLSDLSAYSKDKKTREGTHLGSLKNVIFWNIPQWHILHSNIKRLLFLTDFGAGKTLLLKQIARWLADPSSSLYTGDQVVYMCLAAASPDGKPYTSPTVMDIANKVEFADVPHVTVMSVPDLAQELNDSSSDVVRLLEKYAQLHPNRHLILDEMSIGKKSETIKDTEAVLSSLYSRPGTAHTCIAVRSGQATRTDVKATVQDLKTKMETLSVHIPELPHNMRNSGTVVTLATQLDFNQPQSALSPGKSLGGHTVPGPRPVLITVDSVFNDDNVKHAVSEAITRLDLPRPLTSPVVVLCESNTSDVCRRAVPAAVADTTVYLPSEHGGRDQAAEDALKRYIENPLGLLLTTDRWFAGMEAANVVAISSGVSGGGWLRDMALRTTGQLVIIVAQSDVKNMGVDITSQFKVFQFLSGKFLNEVEAKKHNEAVKASEDKKLDEDKKWLLNEFKQNPSCGVIVSADEGEAAEHHGDEMGLYRPLGGGSYQQVGGSYFLYQVLPEGDWWISSKLMERAGVMLNETGSTSVPASGWKYVAGGGWHDDPGMSVKICGQEDLQCGVITITSSRCTLQKALGDFTRIQGDFLNGLPVFRNTHNSYLRVATGGTLWGVGGVRDERASWLRSGRATSCPAHRNSGLSGRFNRKYWESAQGKNGVVEDPTLQVKCDVHSKPNSST